MKIGANRTSSIMGFIVGSGILLMMNSAVAQNNLPLVSPTPGSIEAEKSLMATSPNATPTATPASPKAAVAAEPAALAVPVSDKDDEAVHFYGNRKRPERKDKKIYNGYFGVEGGLAQASGTYLPLGSGIAYGLTAGVDTPAFGLGLTFQHESLAVMHTDDRQSISQLMAELNFFSYLLLNGGLQLGDVLQDVRGATINSFGIGFHVGFDLHFSEEWTAGLAASWTFVTQNSDKHSLFNIVIPIKYWF